MLDLFGSSYVLDHVIAEHNIRMEEKVYRGYTADMLKVIAEGMGAEVYYRLNDLLEKKEVSKTGDEVALEVINKLGLKVKE